MRGNCLAFCDQFSAEMHRFGRTAPQLFGIHPENGTLRLDRCGGVMVNDRPVVGVEDARIVFDRFSGYRARPGPVFGPPIREFAARGGRT